MFMVDPNFANTRHCSGRILMPVVLGFATLPLLERGAPSACPGRCGVDEANALAGS